MRFLCFISHRHRNRCQLLFNSLFHRGLREGAPEWPAFRWLARPTADWAAQFGTGDVTVLVTPEFGHIDHSMTPRHREFVERPIFQWVRRVLGR